MEVREKCAAMALEDVCAWLDGGGEVAVSTMLYIYINLEYFMKLGCSTSYCYPKEMSVHYEESTILGEHIPETSF